MTIAEPARALAPAPAFARPRVRATIVALAALSLLAYVLPHDAAILTRASLLAAPLLLLAWRDARTRILPNHLVASVAIVAAITAPMAGGPSALGALGGGAAGFAVMLAFYAILGGLGAGDVKLVGAIGLTVGLGELGTWAILGTFAAGAVAVALLATRRASRGDSMPFGPPLIFGALVMIAIDAVGAL